MKFDNTFELPLPVEQAWVLLLDVPRITPCIPGAELVEVESDRAYKGKVSVRLGPVALTFNGRAVIESIDDSAHKARIKAQGMDAKGRGAASAFVDFELQPSAKGSKVIIVTDLTLSGAVAQYGRGAGIIREVAAQFTRDFVTALEAQLSAQAATSEAAAAKPTTAAPPKPQAISGFTLIWRVILAMLHNVFGRRSPS
jgi:carbon monoxide dehydrogenase subunit G